MEFREKDVFSLISFHMHELGDHTFQFISTHISSNEGVREWCSVIFFKAHASGVEREVRPIHMLIETNKHSSLETKPTVKSQ
jgi:hypothetical protein